MIFLQGVCFINKKSNYLSWINRINKSSKIKYISSEEIDTDEYYFKYFSRDFNAREQYKNMIETNSVSEGTFVMDIIRNGVGK